MSDPNDLHKRLEELNRAPLAKPPAEASDGEPLRDSVRKRLRTRRGGADKAPGPAAAKGAPQPIVFQRDVPRREPPARPVLRTNGPAIALGEALDGAEAADADGRCAYLLERRLRRPDGPWCPLCDGLIDAAASHGSGLWAELRRMEVTGAIGLGDVVFLDLETAGLGSSPAFLIGTMVWEAGGLVTRQYFARDYSEERAALGLFLQWAETRRLLVTFNGKSFDLPFVRTRAAANGLACPYAPAHLDLLHVARRAWGPELPDCRLQTLERVICGRPRDDDIPGHLIPDAYHEYVRTGNAIRMVSVLEHNFLDLVTLADLLVRLPCGDSPATNA